MSILLIVVVVTFKSWCLDGFSSTFMCLMTLLVSLMIVIHVLRFDILVYELSLANISNMSFLTTKMISGFCVLTFVTSFFISLG